MYTAWIVSVAIFIVLGTTEQWSHTAFSNVRKPSTSQLPHTRLHSLHIGHDEWIGLLSGRAPLRQEQRGEKKTVLRQFDHSDITLSANTRDGQFALFQAFAKGWIEAVVAKIPRVDFCRTVTLVRTAAGCQVNGLSLANQRAGELANQ